MILKNCEIIKKKSFRHRQKKLLFEEFIKKKLFTFNCSRDQLRLRIDFINKLSLAHYFYENRDEQMI